MSMDQAFQLFQDKKYSDAATAFAGLLNDESVPAHQKARIEQFHRMAAGATQESEGPESSAALFSYYMNNGRLTEAKETLEKLELNEDARLYLSAEVAIESGDVETCLELLKQAVELNEDNAGYALNSPAFADYIKDEAFQFLRSDASDED